MFLGLQEFSMLRNNKITANVEMNSQLEKLVSLLKSEKFVEAVEYAKNLEKNGVSYPHINHRCYDYFSTVNFKEPEKAKKIAEIFADFKWKYWLSETIKTKNAEKKYV